MCREVFLACNREPTTLSTLQHHQTSLTAEPFHQVKQVSSSVPAKPQGKIAWPKGQLINERVYLRNKQGTSFSAAVLSALLCRSRGRGSVTKEK